MIVEQMLNNVRGLTKFFALLKCSFQGRMFRGKNFCLSPCYAYVIFLSFFLAGGCGGNFNIN